MNEELKYTFIALGIIFSLLLAFLFITIIFEICHGFIKDMKWKWKYKHRFDKKPIARCYCKDCIYYSSNAESCDIHSSWIINDNNFCWKATPRSYDSGN